MVLRSAAIYSRELRWVHFSFKYSFCVRTMFLFYLMRITLELCAIGFICIHMVSISELSVYVTATYSSALRCLFLPVDLMYDQELNIILMPIDGKLLSPTMLAPKSHRIPIQSSAWSRFLELLSSFCLAITISAERATPNKIQRICESTCFVESAPQQGTSAYLTMRSSSKYQTL